MILLATLTTDETNIGNIIANTIGNTIGNTNGNTISNTIGNTIGNTDGNISIQVATTLRLPQYEHWAMYDEWLR